MAKTFAEIRSERKIYLRFLRKSQRAFDTELERFERTIFRLLDRKTVLDVRDGQRLAAHWRSTVEKARAIEKGLADFFFIISR